MNSVDPGNPFATWLDEQTQWKVKYSIPLFHEIDFFVNEGYRRIPHGGVEVGGVLYGALEVGQVSISAFRPIECDHAAGPSFLLSQTDLTRLADSISLASQDEELKSFTPIGWFIAHTRGPLLMTSRELQIFEQFFPKPGQVTVLVKPERFKATRFSFLVRDKTGQVNADGTNASVILPLSGRASQDPDASIAKAATSPPDQVTIADRPKSAEDAAGVNSPATPEEPVKLTIEPPVREQVDTVLAQPPPAPAQIRQDLPQRVIETPRHQRSSGWLAGMILIAALLGCGVGYWAYLQLPSPVITLRLHRRQSDLLVVWNPAQTQPATDSAIRVNDGQPISLSNEQKTSGIAEVPLTGGDMKIEIVSHQWARESRGIVRFLQAAKAPGK